MPADFRSQIKAVVPRLREAQAEALARERRARAAAERSESERLKQQQDFAAATRGVKPLEVAQRAQHAAPQAAPLPLMHRRDEAAALAATLSDGVDAELLLDTDEALWFARDGLAPNTVRKLRRGDWVIQAQLDLHGMTRDEARGALTLFLHSALRQGLRCVRVVHGKGLGSKNRAPVLKDKVRRWLMQSDPVLAFVQARAMDGGAGALIVLLRNS
jgi:DNA-nicking Smr family endonuclease